MSHEGFFPESLLITKRKESLDSLAQPKCGACGLYKTCRSPKIPLYGKGGLGILVVGEAPGELEDKKGKPFVGSAGQFLRETLDSIGVDLYRDCWTTNAAICRPPNNELPKASIGYCRPNLLRIIHETKPRCIILLGEAAVKSLIGWLWRENVDELKVWLGWKIPSQQLNAWVCPTFHPSYVNQQKKAKDTMTVWWFEEHLKAAVEVAKSRPWKVVPDYDSMVKVVMDDDEAADRIREITKLGEPTAADYETNCLKSSYIGSKIICCGLSVLGSNEAIAFLWKPKAIRAMEDFWFSKIKKVLAKLDFENQWTYWQYKRWIRNIYLDVVLMAHVLNCRAGITSVKLQSLVRLGYGAYDDHISPLLESRVGVLNDAEFEIEPRQFCQYCGTDALVEGFIGLDQLKELKQR